MPEQQPRRFASFTRTICQTDWSHTLDAIDDDGRAWWLIVGNDQAPDTWTELQPLPSRKDQP
jgi:hypothetical protein